MTYQRKIRSKIGLVAKVAGSTLVVLAAPLLSVSRAAAAAPMSFADHLWKFASTAGAQTNTIDFKQGGSKIYNNYNLHVATDDRLYLDAPQFVQVSNDLNVNGDVNVNGTSTFNNDVNVDGDVTVTGTITAPLGVDYTELAGVTGDFTVGGELGDWSSTAFQVQDPNGDNLIQVDTSCDGDAYSCVSIGSSSDGGELDVNTDTYFNDNIEVDGYAEFEGDVEIEANLYTDEGITLQRDDGDYGNLLDVQDADGFSLLHVDSSCDGDGYSCVTVDGGTDGGEFDVNTEAYFDDDVTVYDSNLDLNYTDLSFTCGVSCNWDIQGNDGNGSLTVYNGDTDTNVLSLLPGGDLTITGASRHATLDLANDGDLNVEGHTTLGSSSWDDLTVNATASFNSDVVLGTDPDNSITVNGRLYGFDGDPVTVGHYAEMGHDGFKVWGTTDLRGDLLLGGWGAENSALVFQNGSYAQFDYNGGDDNWQQYTDGSDFKLYNSDLDADVMSVNDSGNFEFYNDLTVDANTTLGSSSLNDLTVNATSTFNSDVTVGCDGPCDEANLTVNGDTTLGIDPDNSITVNGRLYGFDGDPVTIGHYSDNSGLKVWGDSDLRGNLTVGGWGSDDTGIDVSTGDANIWDGDVNIENGNLYVNNNTETDSLNVDGVSTFDGTATFTNNAQVNGTLTVNNLTINGTTNWGSSVTYGGAATYNSTAAFNGSTTFGASVTNNGAVTFNSTLTANAGVDFSGASSLRVPVVATALVDNTTTCTTTGRITFSTNDGHFYGCDGAHWQIFDN